MAYTNISGLFTGICDAIRLKGGAAGNINHQNIPNAILNISGGGGGGGCDLGIIYLDPDPYAPVNQDSGGGSNNVILNNGGGNNGGGNNNSGPTGPRAQVYVSNNVYNMSYAFASPFNGDESQYWTFNTYCASGPNVTSMDSAFLNNTSIIGCPVFGPNVSSAYRVYEGTCIFGDVHIERNDMSALAGAFSNCYYLNGSIYTNSRLGSNEFHYCNNIVSAYVNSWIENGQNCFYNCINLTNMIFSWNNGDGRVFNCQTSSARTSLAWRCSNMLYSTGAGEWGGGRINIFLFNSQDFNDLRDYGFSLNIFGNTSDIRQRTFYEESYNSAQQIWFPMNVMNKETFEWNNYEIVLDVYNEAYSGGNGYASDEPDVYIYNARLNTSY